MTLAVRVPILYYHRVEDHLPPAKGVSPRAFAAQMGYLRKKKLSKHIFRAIGRLLYQGATLAFPSGDHFF